MPRDLLIGIDAGTSVIKSVAFTLDRYAHLMPSSDEAARSADAVHDSSLTGEQTGEQARTEKPETA